MVIALLALCVALLGSIPAPAPPSCSERGQSLQSDLTIAWTHGCVHRAGPRD